MTGVRLPGTRGTVEQREQLLLQLQAALAPPVPPRTVVRAAGGGFPGDDGQLLDVAFNAMNGAKVLDLWQGQHHKVSFSESLLGLGRMLAFYTGDDPERLERLIVASPLFSLSERERPKWNSRRGGDTWGMRFVVLPAIATCIEFYAGAGAVRSRGAGQGEEQVEQGSRTEDTQPCKHSSHFRPPRTPARTTVRNPIGHALRLVEGGHVPARLDRITARRADKRNALRRMAAVCWHLAGRRTGGRFRLSVEAAGRAFGTHHATPARWLLALDARGVIRRTVWGNTQTGLASEWEWVGVLAVNRRIGR
jgi:hypothetical protein